MRFRAKAKNQAPKYNNKRVVVDGWNFDSKKEARYYMDLKRRQESGEVSFFLRQVPFHLPNGVVMRIDFLVFYKDGTAEFIDTKGVITEAWDVKRKICEGLYPVKIETI